MDRLAPPDAELDARRPTIADLQRAQGHALRRGDRRSVAAYEVLIAQRIEAAQATAGELADRGVRAPAVDAGRARADEALERRRRRVGRIRRRVAAGAVSLFIASTAGVTVQLVSGHDPALASSAGASKSSAAAVSAEAQYVPPTDSSSSAAPASPSPVTTSQS
jgi:hypothetical protein